MLKLNSDVLQPSIIFHLNVTLTVRLDYITFILVMSNDN